MIVPVLTLMGKNKNNALKPTKTQNIRAYLYLEETIPGICSVKHSYSNNNILITK